MPEFQYYNIIITYLFFPFSPILKKVLFFFVGYSYLFMIGNIIGMKKITDLKSKSFLFDEQGGINMRNFPYSQKISCLLIFLLCQA